jgi:tetratricopeptide (TPR) repeat protein
MFKVNQTTKEICMKFAHHFRRLFDGSRAYAEKAQSYHKRRNLQQALEYYSKAIEAYSKAEYYDARASIYSTLQLYERSIEDYTQAIALTPQNPWLYIRRGISRFQQSS